ncbi:MAG: EAL domain-containing protein [Steroidobacteraceae bacterium]|nr:EAL domain-containing protein [Steroidobacteraceae bacterium]
MKQPAAVPMIALTRSQDNVEAINKALRNAGHPVHVTWLPDARDLGDALTQASAEMLMLFADEAIVDLASAMDFRARFAPDVPVLVVRERLDEDAIAQALALGAQDAVTLTNVPRLQLVVGRELRTYRLDRALSSTLASAREYKKQLQHIVEGSTDAIAQVQEGIIVDANPAWLALFGYSNADEVVGTPLMDAFDPDDHAAIKGALVACMQGKWSGHTLHASALVVSGHTPSLEFQLVRAEFDGEPCVQVVVPARVSDAGEYQRKLEEAMQSDPATGFMHRRYFVDKLRERLAQPARGGVRFLAYGEADKYEAVHEELGVLAGEDFLTDFARLLKEQVQPGDLAGRFGGHGFMMLIERGNTQDVEAWAEHVVHKVASEVFQAGSKSLTTTCTIGLGPVPPEVQSPEGPANDAWRAHRQGREAGGNRVQLLEHTGMMLRLQDQDRAWVQQIRAALTENRFRLVQQPIASLVGDDLGMFDVLVRMLDAKGQEVLPSAFLPAAERNDLMKSIDRWVIGASMAFCAARKPGALFVRLSQDTLADPTLAAWLASQLKSTRIDAARIVFQVREEAVAQQLKEAVALRQALQKRGFRFAIEGFGLGRDTERLLGHLKPEFVKIHGALMQGLSADQEKQARVKTLVELARDCRAVTIGERVQDANTMAVLWQLGVEFIQGYFVNAPEEVVIG